MLPGFFAALPSLLVLPALGHAAETSPSRILRLGSLVDHCSFKLGDTNFDLCPIVNGNEGGWTIESKRWTPPSITTTTYKLNLKEPLQKDSGMPADEQCPSGTWICQTISNRRPRHEGEEPRVFQVVPVAGAMNLQNATRYRPGVNVTAQLTSTRDDPKVSILHVRLHGGYYVYGQQKADIQFLCDRSIDEPSTPTYSWTWNGTHTFQWRTKHACGSRQATPVPNPDKDTPPTSSEDGQDDSPPPPDEEPSDGQELTGGHPMSGRAKHTTIVLLSCVTVFITVAYLVWRPPTRVRKYVTSLVKAHPRLGRFRVGESVLVRWAYEDLEMEEDYGDGEDDTMVNFAAEEETGEGIPLKPSPRKGRWVSYGTA